jgi:CRP-like cAMP-binding protein
MRHSPDDLSALPLFARTTRSERAAIRRHLTPLQVCSGRVLTQGTAPAEQFMIVAEGKVTLRQDGCPIGRLERGDFFGDVALLRADCFGRAGATVSTESDTTVYAGTRTEFLQILEVAPSVALEVLKSAAARGPRRAA